MKKLVKILAVLAAVVAVLLIAAFITLKIMFPADKIKTIAQDYMQKNYHREITFSGVSFNIIGVTLDNFALSEVGTFEQNGTFVKADQAVVKLALLPLFRKKIEIATVGLDGMEITVQKNTDGKFNFDDFISSSAQPAPAEQAPQPQESSFAFSITAQNIYANNCVLTYRDLQSGMQTSIHNLNLQIKDFDLNAPFEAQISFTTNYQDKTGLQASLPLKLSLQAFLANLDLSKAEVTITDFSLTYKNIAVSVTGTAKNLQNPSVELNGKISGVSNLALADLAQDLPSFTLPDILLNLSAKLDLENSAASIEQAKLSIQDSFVQAQGSAGWGGTNPTYNIAAGLNFNLTQIAQMSTLTDGFNAGGTISGHLTATHKKDGQDVQGNISLSNLAVEYPPFTLSQLSGKIILKSLSDISSNSLTGLLNAEKFTTDFAYKDLGGVLDLVFNFDLAKLTLSSFSMGHETASAEEKPAQTENQPAQDQTAASSAPETFFNVQSNIKVGQIQVPYFTTAGLTLQANIKNASATMKKSNGTVSFALQEGAITDLDSFVKENRIVKILMLPFTLINKVTAKLGVEIFPTQNTEDKGKIKFTVGEGEYLFQNGLMTIQKTNFNSALSNMNASGTLDFKTEALNMKVSATVLTSQTPIVIKIGGTMSDPNGKLDVASTAVSLVGGILNYKTPLKAAQTTTDTAKTVVNGTVDAGTEAIKGTVNAAVDTIKGIGSLFKKSSTKQSEETQQK